MLSILYLFVGIALLTCGGEALIRGSLAAARRLGVSPLLSGLVIVGFGTSTPELVVSVNAAIEGRPDIAIGNVVGSNISNILLILGICAVITPLAVKPLVLRRDTVTVVAASILLLVLVGGAQVLLIGAIGIAERFDVPEAAIGLTLVAVGTSLPELSISVIAAIRRHADVAVWLSFTVFS